MKPTTSIMIVESESTLSAQSTSKPSTVIQRSRCTLNSGAPM